MIGAGTFINPLIKVAVTVAILAAVYFFFVKPALDTTDKAFESGAELSESINDSVSDSIRQANEATENAFNNPTVKRAQKRAECISKAGGNVDKINGCNEKFPP